MHSQEYGEYGNKKLILHYLLSEGYRFIIPIIISPCGLILLAFYYTYLQYQKFTTERKSDNLNE